MVAARASGPPRRRPRRVTAGGGAGRSGARWARRRAPRRRVVHAAGGVDRDQGGDVDAVVEDALAVPIPPASGPADGAGAAPTLPSTTAAGRRAAAARAARRAERRVRAGARTSRPGPRSKSTARRARWARRGAGSVADREADAVLLQPGHDPVGGGEAVGAAPGQADGVGVRRRGCADRGRRSPGCRVRRPGRRRLATVAAGGSTTVVPVRHPRPIRWWWPTRTPATSVRSLRGPDPAFTADRAVGGAARSAMNAEAPARAGGGAPARGAGAQPHGRSRHAPRAVGSPAGRGEEPQRGLSVDLGGLDDAATSTNSSTWWAIHFPPGP